MEILRLGKEDVMTLWVPLQAIPGEKRVPLQEQMVQKVQKAQKGNLRPGPVSVVFPWELVPEPACLKLVMQLKRKQDDIQARR